VLACTDHIEEKTMRTHTGRKPHWRQTAALLAALALAAPAWGQMQGSAQATGLRYALGDLAPDDGITPSASFGPAPGALLTGSVTRLISSGEPFQRSGDITVMAPATYAPDWLPQARPVARFDADGTHADVSVAPLEDATVVGIAGAHLSPWIFRLAPHSSITFSLDVAIDLALTEGDAATEFGAADAYLSLYYRTAGGAWSSPIGDGVAGWVGTSQDGVYLPFLDLASTAMVSWSNDSDGWIDGQVLYESSVLGQVQYGPPLPVPEPHTWAMLLAGAGVLVAAAQKKSPRRRGVGSGEWPNV
jgi:hypothetical protein